MGVSGELNWDLGSAKLTSITAWRDNTIVAGNDVDYTGIDIVYEPGTEGNLTDFKQFSEELRLAGKDGPLDWLVGGFFSSEILTSNTAICAGNDFDLYVGGVSSASIGTNPPNFLVIPGFTGQPPGGTFIPGVSGEQDFYHQTSKSYAFFTNETYNITQGLDLTAGLRFTSEKKTADSNYVDPDGGSGCGRLLDFSGGRGAEPRKPPIPVSDRLRVLDGVQSVLRRTIDRPILKRGQPVGHGQAVLSLQRGRHGIPVVGERLQGRRLQPGPGDLGHGTGGSLDAEFRHRVSAGNRGILRDRAQEHAGRPDRCA